MFRCGALQKARKAVLRALLINSATEPKGSFRYGRGVSTPIACPQRKNFFSGCWAMSCFEVRKEPCTAFPTVATGTGICLPELRTGGHALKLRQRTNSGTGQSWDKDALVVQQSGKSQRWLVLCTASGRPRLDDLIHLSLNALG